MWHKVIFKEGTVSLNSKFPFSLDKSPYKEYRAHSTQLFTYCCVGGGGFVPLKRALARIKTQTVLSRTVESISYDNYRNVMRLKIFNFKNLFSSIYTVNSLNFKI